MGRGTIMARFISDDDMAKIDASITPKTKRVISDDEMMEIEASAPSKAESAARGVAQGASMGFADEVSGGIEALWEKAKGDPTSFGELYKKSRDESRANFDRAEKTNPNSYTAGLIGGAGATAFVPGMGATTLGKLAVQGAAQGLGDSKADLTEGDIGGAARDAAIGGTIGAAVGVAGKALSAGASKAMPYIKKATNAAGDFLQSGAEKLAVKATGATGRQAENFAPNAGRDLLDSGLVKFGDDAAKIAERVGARADQAGKAINSSLLELEEKGVTASVDRVINKLQAQVDELSTTPGNEKIINQLTKEIENLYARGESTVGINVAEQAKRNFQSATNYFSDEAEKKATGRLATSFKDEVERVAMEADPTLAKKFMDEKKAYGLLKPIQDASEKRASTLNQSPFGGLLDMATSGAGGTVGGGVGAIVAPIARRQIANRAASTGAVISDNIGKYVKSSPHLLGKFAKVLQDANVRGAQSLAATHFLLQQTEPEYRQIVNTEVDEESEE